MRQCRVELSYWGIPISYWGVDFVLGNLSLKYNTVGIVLGNLYIV